jgi:DNA helicase-2/ATP-dependent DNA helicase PcrA
MWCLAACYAIAPQCVPTSSRNELSQSTIGSQKANIMSSNERISSLNPRQQKAANLGNQHALVLAGAGSGKTKTIVARAAYLIEQGVPAHQILILTFTKRAASEIVARVKSQLGERAAQLQASTFHAWCINLIHQAPNAFQAKKFTVIDREDQVMLFKAIRGKSKDYSSNLPTAAQLCDIYSYARNTGKSLSQALTLHFPDFVAAKDQMVPIMKAYEAKKQENRYLDFDDILDRVAKAINDVPKACEWVARQYDHILVDEMQDTNPLQWSLLSPLKEHCCLFCVGDDAQSIYGFRGADFKNVHSFQDRVPGAVVLKLNKNYRSTQEILDVPNWLLANSPLEYGKQLVAARGAGVRPQLHNFSNEWDEGGWIAKDIQRRRSEGDNWKDHLILSRSSSSARAIESCLLAANIPYRVIGGAKLLESAHIRDLLSLLRIIGNPRDEIAIMRYLTLFPGVGTATANRAIARLKQADTLKSAITMLRVEKLVPLAATDALVKVSQQRGNVAEAITTAARILDKVLERNYRNLDWPKRQSDFKIVAKLAEKHTSILGFIEEYLLDPIHISMVKRSESDDVVTIITIHSAKGAECKTCYVINVSPGAFPSNRAMGDPEQVEEERRVLYVALTRAMDHLIVTRQKYATWALPDKAKAEAAETYFFNKLPRGLFDEFTHNQAPKRDAKAPSFKTPQFSGGINFD